MNNKNISPNDEKYMRRAIELSRLGLGNVSPNPHVGAVIVADGRIIGEGYHRRCGEGHAEVNAVASVSQADLKLLPDATMYVSLEPCSHYGKTPPCAKLIVDKKIGRIVIGAGDPNPKVNGKGIEMISQAGAEVALCSGDLEKKARDIDRHFLSKFDNGRPFITLKWAQSADGYMADRLGRPVKFSTPLTTTLVHKLRGAHDVILTSGKTVNADDPLMDTRFFKAAKSPQRVVVDRSGVAKADAKIFETDAEGRKTIYYTEKERTDLPGAEVVVIKNLSLEDVVNNIKSRGFNSVLVEAGPGMLQSFISNGLFDVVRVETSKMLLGENGGCSVPVFRGVLKKSRVVESNEICEYEAGND